MINKKVIFIFVNACVLFTHSHTTQMPSRSDSESSPFLDVATSFLEEALSSQNSVGGDNGNGMAGIAQLIGSLMQSGDSAKSNNGAMGAAQILSGIGSLLASSNSGRNGGGGGGSGFDPSLIGNVLEMFTSGDDSDDGGDSSRRKRSNGNQDGAGIETLVNLASLFMGNANNVDSEAPNGKNEGLMNLLPMIVQAVNSFSGQEGERVLAKHKDHQWVLPPFLERIHVMWDHFSNSELAEALWAKSGINAIFKVRLFSL